MKQYNRNIDNLYCERGGGWMREELVSTRRCMGMTQSEMASILGISRSFYGLIENGSRNPDYGLAKRIAKILKVSPDTIFFDLDGFEMKQKTKANVHPNFLSRK